MVWLGALLPMRNIVKAFSVASFGFLVAVSACSSGGGTNDGGTDAANETSTVKDSGTQKEAAVVDSALTCTADASYSETTLTSQTAGYIATPADAGADAGPEDFYEFDGNLNSDADILELDLFDGFTVFANGIAPGTYTIGADDGSWETCGVCVLLLTDATSPQSFTDTYIATSGSVTITSVSPTGTLAGSVSNLKFSHVTIDFQGGTQSAGPDSCTSALPSASFSATVTQQ